MTEQELLREIVHLCEEHRLLVFHSGDSRRDTGAGFPDCVIVGRHHILFVELKSDTGHLTAEQNQWHWSLLAAGQYWSLWRPKDLPHIPSVLREL